MSGNCVECRKVADEIELFYVDPQVGSGGRCWWDKWIGMPFQIWYFVDWPTALDHNFHWVFKMNRWGTIKILFVVCNEKWEDFWKKKKKFQCCACPDIFLDYHYYQNSTMHHHHHQKQELFSYNFYYVTGDLSTIQIMTMYILLHLVRPLLPPSILANVGPHF